MPENLMNPAHKSTNKKYRRRYDQIIWNGNGETSADGDDGRGDETVRQQRIHSNGKTRRGCDNPIGMP